MKPDPALVSRERLSELARERLAEPAEAEDRDPEIGFWPPRDRLWFAPLFLATVVISFCG